MITVYQVLIVEDYEPDAALTALNLQSKGPHEEPSKAPGAWDYSFEHTHVKDLAGAVAELKRTSEQGNEAYDLILLDMGLPDSRGLNGLVRLLEVAPSVPVIILSGVASDQVVMNALRLGAQDVLAKDHVTEPGDLRLAARKAIGRQVRLDELHKEGEEHQQRAGELRAALHVADRMHHRGISPTDRRRTIDRPLRQRDLVAYDRIRDDLMDFLGRFVAESGSEALIRGVAADFASRLAALQCSARDVNELRVSLHDLIEADPLLTQKRAAVLQALTSKLTFAIMGYLVIEYRRQVWQNLESPDHNPTETLEAADLESDQSGHEASDPKGH
jgi:DNA-binding response OmpR family regulator